MKKKKKKRILAFRQFSVCSIGRLFEQFRQQIIECLTPWGTCCTLFLISLVIPQPFTIKKTSIDKEPDRNGQFACSWTHRSDNMVSRDEIMQKKMVSPRCGKQKKEVPGEEAAFSAVKFHRFALVYPKTHAQFISVYVLGEIVGHTQLSRKNTWSKYARTLTAGKQTPALSALQNCRCWECLTEECQESTQSGAFLAQSSQLHFISGFLSPCYGLTA